MSNAEGTRTSKRGSSAAGADGHRQRRSTKTRRSAVGYKSSVQIPIAPTMTSTVARARASIQADDISGGMIARQSFCPPERVKSESASGKTIGDSFFTTPRAVSAPRLSKASRNESPRKSAPAASTALLPSSEAPKMWRGIAKANARQSCTDMVPGFATRFVGNLAGFAGLGAGYALGKLETTLKGSSMADSGFFHSACSGMLLANGIIPTVVCEYGNDEVGQLPTDEEAQSEILRSTSVIVSNHVSYLDAVVLPVVLNMPKFVSKSDVKSWPLFGALGKDLDFIWVDRNNPDSRGATVDAINNHVRTWKNRDRPVVLFPEGTTSSGESLLEFRKGAFVPGKPVRPVVLKYTGAWDPSNPDYREAAATDSEDDYDNPERLPGVKQKVVAYREKDWAAQFAGHMVHTCIVLICKKYEPSPEEQADPLLYMENVRNLMQKRLQELHRVFSKPGDSGFEADRRIRAWRRRKSMSKQVSSGKDGKGGAAKSMTRSKSAGPALSARGEVRERPDSDSGWSWSAISKTEMFRRKSKKDRIKESSSRRQSYYEDPQADATEIAVAVESAPPAAVIDTASLAARRSSGVTVNEIAVAVESAPPSAVKHDASFAARRSSGVARPVPESLGDSW